MTELRKEKKSLPDKLNVVNKSYIECMIQRQPLITKLKGASGVFVIHRLCHNFFQHVSICRVIKKKSLIQLGLYYMSWTKLINTFLIYSSFLPKQYFYTLVLAVKLKTIKVIILRLILICIFSFKMFFFSLLRIGLIGLILKYL